MTEPNAPMLGMMAVVTARTVSGAALSIPQTRTMGEAGVAPARERKQAAYLILDVS